MLWHVLQGGHIWLLRFRFCRMRAMKTDRQVSHSLASRQEELRGKWWSAEDEFIVKGTLAELETSVSRVDLKPTEY